MIRRLLVFAFILTVSHAFAGRSFAEQQSDALTPPAPAKQEPYPAVPLLSTGTSILGEPLRYPTTGPAQVTAALVALAPGEKTSIHKHGVPVFAYILEGELTVDYAGYKQRTYRAGEAFMEAMDVAHFGINTGQQTMRLLAVYIVAQGAQDVIPVK